MFSSSMAEENDRAAHNNDVTTASLQQNLLTSNVYVCGSRVEDYSISKLLEKRNGHGI